MTDNGFGARANSADSELWINKVRVDFGSGANGAVTLLGGFGLSDPKGYIPWKIVCDQIKGTALPDFDFNKLPTMTPQLNQPCGDKALRKLTGFDFDLESMQIGADGSFWFGEEFGPFLLGVGRVGRERPEHHDAFTRRCRTPHDSWRGSWSGCLLRGTRRRRRRFRR